MSPKSILLVDDDKDILSVFNMALIERGFIVDTALNGSQALSKVKTKKYDLVVLDVMLPDIRGDKLALKIKELNDSTNLVFITGYDSMQNCINSLSIGVSDILLKPITVEELQNTVINSFAMKTESSS